MAKILLVEDDIGCADAVESWLSSEHYTVEPVHNGKEALFRISNYDFDLLILDWELPDSTGVEILKQLRAQGKTTPVLMLTGRSGIEDKEQCFVSGVDDYLTKPVNLRELTMRVGALLRRAAGQVSRTLQIGDLVLDAETFCVNKAGQEIRLQKKEFALLEFLMRNPNKVFSADALLQRVWSTDSEATEDALRTCMMRLRKKLDKDSELIETLHGIGYKLKKV